MSAITEDTTVWQALLRGEPVEYEAYTPYCGCYRGRDREGRPAAVCIYVRDGEMLVWDGRKQPGWRTYPATKEWAEREFGYLLKHPITAESYSYFVEHERFPEDVTVPEVPRSHADRPNAAPHAILQERIAEVRAEAKGWLVSIGGEVKTQEHSDKAANYASVFDELQKEAEAARVAEKEPHLKAGREVDATWKPVAAAGDEGKRWAKSLCEPWFKAERARKAAEAAAKAAAGEAVRPEDLKVKSGTRGRAVSPRIVRDLVYSDFGQACARYRDDTRIWGHPDVRALLDRIITEDLKAGTSVPGAALVERMVAA